MNLCFRVIFRTSHVSRDFGCLRKDLGLRRPRVDQACAAPQRCVASARSPGPPGSGSTQQGTPWNPADLGIPPGSLVGQDSLLWSLAD